MLLSQLENVYSKYNDILVCDRPLLNTPIETQQQHSNKCIESFLKYIKPLLKISLACAAKHGSSFVPINKYFHPIRLEAPQDPKD